MTSNNTQSRRDEQTRLDHVIGEINKRQKKLNQSIKRAKTEEKSLNEHFYDDVKINYVGDSTTIETALSIRQQQQMLMERNNSWQHASGRLDVLEKLENNPYFARVDFKEKGEPGPETIYIGLSSFTNDKDEFLVYDWRAPISSIYYDGKLGDVTYNSPEGKQDVNLSLKRQFIIKDGQIENMFDTQETIGDQMLLEVLNEKSSSQMKTIVTTIQQEQNAIIRDTDSDLLFVQGAAGSGKTSAVLQRIAYLLYRYRGNLTSDQVIMFSPNQLFNDYVQNVLPELGEQNMVQMTYWQFASRRVPNFKVQNLFQQFEQAQSDASEKITNLKSSYAFFNLLTRYGNRLARGGVQFRNIKFRGESFIDKEKIKEIYYGFNENYKLMNRIEATKEELIKILNRRVSSEMKKKWVQEMIEGLSEEQLRMFYQQPDQEFESGDDEYKFIAKRIVTESLESVAKYINNFRFINFSAQYNHFMQQVPRIFDLEEHEVTTEEWQAEVKQTLAKMKAKELPIEDVSCYLYLYDLLTGKTGERSMKFVFIDEIQDYTPFQIAYLKFNFPNARFTMLGDLNQTILATEPNQRLLADISHLFDPEKTSVTQLTTSYRSTKQVTDFTRGILRNGQKITAFERIGPKPVMVACSDEAEMVDELADQLTAQADKGLTTAVITKSLQESKDVFNQLKQKGVKSTLIGSENQRLVEGTLIVPAYLAKGLEFDSVVMYNASDVVYQKESERQLVYTIASRAMHTLAILYTGQKSRLLEDIDESLYEVKTKVK
ncbi:RNA polymerase recycling motor HelD [Holzapfeliella sp. JNUCC 80]